MLRSFTLPDASGKQVHPWEYRQRNNLVLFFHHGADCPTCRSTLQDLAANLPALRAEQAVVLAIGPDQPPAAHHPAAELAVSQRLLCDPAGHTVLQHGLAVPAIVVADRFGEIWAAWQGGDAHALPDSEEIVAWLEFIERQCPECDPLAWRMRE